LPTAYVLPKLTSFKRRQRIRKEDWPHLRGLQLADLNYDKPSTIDIVLEADIYVMLMKDGFRDSRPGEPIAHRMMLGWVLMKTLDPKHHTQQNQVTNLHTMEPNRRLAKVLGVGIAS